jgi:periplasmic protein TonB
VSAPALDAAGREQTRYYRRMELAFVLALAIHAAVMVLAPAYVPRPYKLDATPLRLVAAGAASSGRARAGTAGPAAVETQEPSPRAMTAGIRRAAPILTEQLHPAGPPSASLPSRDGGAAGLDGSEDGAPPLFYAFDAPPRVLDRVVPDYPAHVKAAGGQGSVVLNANVDEHGRVIRVWVAQATAPEALVEAAVDALYRFQFAPGSQQGIPVKCTVAVPFNFNLNVHL